MLLGFAGDSFLRAEESGNNLWIEVLLRLLAQILARLLL